MYCKAMIPPKMSGYNMYFIFGVVVLDRRQEVQDTRVAGPTFYFRNRFDSMFPGISMDQLISMDDV
jgi:hypothetical protein